MSGHLGASSDRDLASPGLLGVRWDGPAGGTTFRDPVAEPRPGFRSRAYVPGPSAGGWPKVALMTQVGPRYDSYGDRSGGGRPKRRKKKTEGYGVSESRLDYLVLSGAPPRPTPGPTDTGGPPSVVGGGQSRQVRLRLSVFGAAVRGRPERAAALAPWELVRCVRMGVVLQRCRSRRSGVCVFALRGLRGWRRG